MTGELETTFTIAQVSDVGNGEKLYRGTVVQAGKPDQHFTLLGADTGWSVGDTVTVTARAGSDESSAFGTASEE